MKNKSKQNKTRQNKTKRKHNKTQKNHNKITKNGWTLVIIKGKSYERGFQHGSILFKELGEIKRFFPVYVREQMEFSSFKKYLKLSKSLIPILKRECNEILQEMQGIVDGAVSKGIHITLEFIVGWNSIMSLWKSHFTHHHRKHSQHNHNKERCTSFIATGEVTETGEIVMAHNAHTYFMEGKFENIIMRIYPDKGHSFVMQTSPGLIWSMTDWFITDSGIIGCESTISDLTYDPKFGVPIFCRIRRVMQYAKTLDDCANFLQTNSAGDYACSWLFGNTKTNEIMLFEQGLKYHNIQKTKSGVFYVANSAIDPKLRMKETTDRTFYDPKTSTGARMLRLGQLLNIDYYGKINQENAKNIIADHYDVSIGKEVMNQLSICNHAELHEKHPAPFGAIDGKVTTTTLAKQSKFYGRAGSSCGRIFNKNEFLKKNPKFNIWREFLPEYTNQPWTLIGI
jgi:hypothetical protein